MTWEYRMPPDSQRSQRGKEAILLLVAVVTSAALAFFRIADAEPHADVLVVQAAFSPGWGELVADFFDSEGFFGGFYPPLYFLTARAFGTLFGQSLPALNAFSAVSLVFLVLISWFGVGVLVESVRPWHRFWFALAVGTSPAHVWWAQTAKYTMFLYASYALSLVFALAFLRKRKWGLAFLFALSTSAVIYTHYVGFFFAAAQFCVISLMVLWRRDWVLGWRLAAAGFATALLSAPLLPTVWEATRLRDQEGYNETYEQPVHLSTLIRGYLMEWNFGYGLLPDKRGVESLKQVASGIGNGDLAGSMVPLGRLALPIVASLVLAAALAIAAHGAYRNPSVRPPVAYLAAVTAFAFLFSYSLGLADRFRVPGLRDMVYARCIDGGPRRSPNGSACCQCANRDPGDPRRFLNGLLCEPRRQVPGNPSDPAVSERAGQVDRASRDR
jgi:hypothetical protein